MIFQSSAAPSACSTYVKNSEKMKKSLTQLALIPFLHDTADTPNPGFEYRSTTSTQKVGGEHFNQ